jgi:hypothetical protein
LSTPPAPPCSTHRSTTFDSDDRGLNDDRDDIEDDAGLDGDPLLPRLPAATNALRRAMPLTTKTQFCHQAPTRLDRPLCTDEPRQTRLTAASTVAGSDPVAALLDRIGGGIDNA